MSRTRTPGRAFLIAALLSCTALATTAARADDGVAKGDTSAKKIAFSNFYAGSRAGCPERSIGQDSQMMPNVCVYGHTYIHTGSLQLGWHHVSGSIDWQDLRKA